MFTFVVTCYNQAQVVLQALESVKYQIKKFGQGQAFQLIVTDDGSTDGSPDAVRGWLEGNGGLFAEERLTAPTWRWRCRISSGEGRCAVPCSWAVR